MDAIDGIEIAGLVQSYRQPVQDLTTALGSVQSSSGYLGAAAGLAALIHAAVCLNDRYLPGSMGWTAPKLPALWRGAPFFVPTKSRAWFRLMDGPRRIAALNVLGLNGSFAHLILEEAEEQAIHPNSALAQGGFYLFPIAGERPQELLDQLHTLQQELTFTSDLSALAQEWYEAASQNPDATYGMAIVGHAQAELQREIEYAFKAVPGVVETGGEWQTPLGSYFTAEPAGRLGGVALVYPGAFNSYPGVGKDLLYLFPSLYQRAAAVTDDLGKVLRERLLYPRSLSALTKEEIAAVEAALLEDPIAMLISGTALAILYTHILEDTFKIHPMAAFGYSLGENSMLYATGVWGQGDQASARLEESETFRVRLAGPQLAIREHWGMAPQAASEPPLWSNYLVMATPERVQAALETEAHVYLTHINTPRQVVIGGDPEACKRVVANLRCASIKAPFDYALHCEVMRSEYAGLAELHDWPIEQVPDLRLYSAAENQPLELAQTAAAQRTVSEQIAHMLTTPLDFPRLVQQVYAEGARVFIEAGAGGNCARWIAKSLKGQPHLSISMDRRGTDDYTTVIRTLARLYSHRVPLDLSPLFQTATERVRL